MNELKNIFTKEFFYTTIKNPLSIFDNEFIRYLFIGVTTFILDFGIYNLLTSVLDTKKIAANLSSVLISTVFNFILTNFWTFKSSNHIGATKLSKYALLALFNYLFNNTLFAIFTQTFNWNDLLSKTIIIIIIVSWNFLLYKFWVFKE